MKKKTLCWNNNWGSVTIETIPLPKLEILTTIIISLECSNDDFPFDFPHTPGETPIDATIAMIKV